MRASAILSVVSVADFFEGANFETGEFTAQNDWIFNELVPAVGNGGSGGLPVG